MLGDVFNYPADGGDFGEQLYGIKQGQQTAAAYSLRFWTLAVNTDWSFSMPTTSYLEGLKEKLHWEVACRNEGVTLDQLITLSIKLYNLLRTR